MNIESQVCSLELAKRLKELSIEQNSYFKYEVRENGYVEIYHSKPTSCAHKYYSAFTVSELGEMLPRKLPRTDGIYALQQDFYSDGFFNIYYCLNDYSPIDFEDEKEADARAKMLIYLIENGFIEVANVA